MMVEKYGGIWQDNGGGPYTLIREHYDAQRDTIQAIYRRNTDGFYTVALYLKVADHQWRLPFWNDVERGSIFETEELAEAHLSALLQARETNRACS